MNQRIVLYAYINFIKSSLVYKVFDLQILKYMRTYVK